MRRGSSPVPQRGVMDPAISIKNPQANKRPQQVEKTGQRRAGRARRARPTHLEPSAFPTSSFTSIRVSGGEHSFFAASPDDNSPWFTVALATQVTAQAGEHTKELSIALRFPDLALAGTTKRARR